MAAEITWATDDATEVSAVIVEGESKTRSRLGRVADTATAHLIGASERPHVPQLPRSFCRSMHEPSMQHP